MEKLLKKSLFYKMTLCPFLKPGIYKCNLHLREHQQAYSSILFPNDV